MVDVGNVSDTSDKAFRCVEVSRMENSLEQGIPQNRGFKIVAVSGTPLVWRVNGVVRDLARSSVFGFKQTPNTAPNLSH